MTQYIPITELKNNEDFSKRRNDWDDLSFAKVGVFNPVDINDALHSIVSHKIREGHFWEYQQTHVLEGKIVTPVEIKITTKRTGKSQKIKSRKYKLNNSKMSFTSHSLERFYERSGRRGYSAKDFYTTKFDEWIGSLTAFQERMRKPPDEYVKFPAMVNEKYEELLSLKSNWLVPFGYGVGEGAFLGTVCRKPTMVNEEYTVRYNRNRPISFRARNRELLAPYFTANTFIHHSHMRKEQRQVCDLVLNGKYDDAFELNFSIQRDEKIKIPISIPTGVTLH
jgi:hypothetical protein